MAGGITPGRVQVTRLYLSSFRNFASLELEPGPGLNVLYGPNGSGKTNILEAIYFLSAGRSYRTAREAELVSWGAEGFTVRADLRGTGSPWLKACYQPQRGCTLSIPASATSARNAAVILPVVLFAPEDLELAGGQPALRRRFLDELAGQLVPGYHKTLGRYGRVVMQRNELLREAQARHLRGELLEAWDEEMAQLAGRLWSARHRVLAGFNPLLEKCYRELGRGEATLAWAPALEEVPEGPGRGDPGAWERSLRIELAARRREEVRYGVTLAGPHRDSLWFTATGREVRQYGSRGEQRSVALAARLAQFLLLREELGCDPVLLLDDVFAELDEARQRAVTGGLPESAQAFLTCVRPSALPPWPGKRARYLRVAGGAVVAEGEDSVPPGATGAPDPAQGAEGETPLPERAGG
ncbi:MAG: DNA replication/repair protein RecF [Bacillota bacterium]|nr:DNA replication/repair protein RecF [Bacillota bacterium]